MLTIKGYFDGTAVALDEPAELAVGQVVRVVVEPTQVTDPALPAPGRSRFGFAKGLCVMRDEFDDPLDEFADDMSPGS